MTSLWRYGTVTSLTGTNAKTIVSSQFAPLAISFQAEKNFLTERSLQFLQIHPYYNIRFNLKKDRNKTMAALFLRNYHVSSLYPFAKVERNIIAAEKISDLEILMGRRLMIMKGGGMPLVISVMVASLYITSSSSYASASAASTPEASFVKKAISSHNIVIFSKSYCPYCKRAKAVFKELNQAPHIIELDQRDDGLEIQDALSEMVGRRTVPQVFIKGKHIGGSDDTVEAHESGKLAELLGVAKDDL